MSQDFENTVNDKAASGVNASMKVKIVPGKMKVLVNYQPPLNGGEPLTVEQVEEVLSSEGITHGIDHNAIRSMCDTSYPLTSHVLASGQQPGKGENARLEMYVKLDSGQKAVEREDGSIDFRNLGNICTVSEGQDLYRRIPPTQGDPGYDIMGNEIPGLFGKDLKIIVGRGTVRDEYDDNLVKAAVNGEIMFVDGVLTISEIHTVKSDVDYETGNIKFNGSVRVLGTVRAGFKIEAEGDVEIQGIVEDAEIISGNDIIITGGFAGNGQGTAKAKRDIYVKFIENQNLRAERDIIITGDSYHAQLSAGRSIIAKGDKSTIVGGTCEAKQSVEAARLGSVACAPTIVKLGMDPRLNDMIHDVDAEIENAQKQHEELEKSVVYLYKLKIENHGQLPMDKTVLLQKLEDARKNLPEKVKMLKQKRQKLLDEQHDFDKSYAEASKQVFPKVQIHIGNQWVQVEDNHGPSRFRVIDGSVARMLK